MIILLFSLFFILLFLRIPIGISLAVSSSIVLVMSGFNLSMLPQKMFTAMESFPLMAIPGFVLAGVILARGGLTKYLINALKAWIGHLPGGLAIVTVLTCMIFAAISGSSPATAAAVGAIMIPAMIENGYDKRYAMGIVAASGTLGMLIPPSIVLIMFGIIAEISIGKLFIAGVIPGIFLTGVLLTSAIFYARKNNYKSDTKASWEERKKHTAKAIWGILLPIIIMGSIYTGIATPTESSIIAVVYGIIVSAFVYKELHFKDARTIIVESINVTSMIFLIIGGASLLGLFLTNEQVPLMVGNWLESINLNKWAFFALTGVLFLVLGVFLESVSIILITLPILLPMVYYFGIDPFHFAIVMTINLEIGMITPPVGLNLFVVSGITKEKLGEVVRGVIPFILLLVLALVVIIVFPSISLWLTEYMK
ncbi:TRAP transporter large permease [Pseudogracilibacillus auburnensis]|uniref:C4-dicarboxylate transporter DctM subunit n=1 Tax=Pseudogracilibacillus auburnensis TaxID=1494959 RepID=A0A2V3W0H6_9BACI|nr:TRAP transporter large permease subunit [Pseudogracilibacillus auburnensis]MBO1002232.1 TRAP transporter large permease subunit [Pseudogracilibacillus auburnensis]PXW87562.1 C4-dicarboxylate transporter DctM subunit [Pseudogracilibacillus auburnensis]